VYRTTEIGARGQNLEAIDLVTDKLLLTLASTVILGFKSNGIHYHI
jgi:hypothetical protein